MNQKNDLELFSNLNFKVSLIRARRRSVGFRVTSAGELLVRAPRSLSQARLIEIIEQKKAWINKTIAKVKSQNEELVGLDLDCEQIKQTKKEAKLQLGLDLQNISQKTGLHYLKFRISSAKTRWGSCSAKNTISLNWRLCLVSENLKNYVIIHELAHTVEKNHGPNFWKLVEKFDPDWKIHRKDLQTFGYLMVDKVD